MKHIPILLVGPPGVGKTASIRAAFDHCEVLLLSAMTEEDIAGLPYRKGEKERRTIPLFIEHLQNASGIRCLFLDELDKARRDVADTLLTLITHPQSFGIPEGTVIIAAANPPEWGGGDGISDAMLSRFSVVQYKPNLQFFIEYIKEKYTISEAMIKAFSSGEIPLLEVAGEGLNRRLTCPRTLEMALQVVESKITMYKKDELIKGLLTANAMSFFLRTINNECSPEMDTASKISRYGIQKAKTQPFRLT